MNNTIQFPNRKIGYKWLIVLTTMLFVVFAIGCVTCGLTLSNYNGQVAHLDSVIAEVKADDDTDDFPDLLTVDGKTLTTGSVASAIDWQQYVGQSITIVVPLRQFDASSERMILLGLVVDGQTVVDSDITIAQNRKRNTIICSCFGVVAGLSLAIGIVVFVRMRRTPKIMQVEVAQIIRSMMLIRQPTAKPNKMATAVYLAVTIAATAFVLVSIILHTDSTVSHAAGVAMIVCSSIAFVVAVLIGGGVLHALYCKKEIEFYAQHFPFDFNDISHLSVRPKNKITLQQRLQEQKAKYPDRYIDAANGLWAFFGEGGIDLLTVEQADAAEGNEIYGEDNNTAALSLQAVTGRYAYAECNFVAVPLYGKTSCPLFVVIKSQLVHDGRLERDMHFGLDSNLLKTLRKYNVPVADLDYILENKRQLMLDNCPKSKELYISPIDIQNAY